ncbi:MAG: hypothetical protein ACYDEP_07795 [Acidimicrobiales bacterium]
MVVLGISRVYTYKLVQVAPPSVVMICKFQTDTMRTARHDRLALYIRNPDDFAELDDLAHIVGVWASSATI